jgi:phosphoribosyl-ATP pyrophosphohydrolase
MILLQSPPEAAVVQAGLEKSDSFWASAESAMSTVLHQLMSVLEDRKINPPPNSYTARLYAGGDAKIGAKITEEAHELLEAAGEAGEQGRRHLIYESSDVIYHLLVLLAHHGIKLQEVEAEIARRFGQSGLDEKAARTVTVAK